VVPTTLELAGLTPPAHIEFKSLLPKLTGEASSPHHLPIVGAYLDKQRMIFDGEYKLIAYPEVPTLRLYHVAKDPFEINDLADQPASQAKLSELFTLLVQWQEANQDPTPIRKYFPDLAKD
jgi:arylsulfatase A-like enzyme